MENNDKLLKGNLVSAYLTENVKKDAELLRDKGIIPKLAMVRVGNNDDDMAYERAAINRCMKCGIETEVINLDSSITEKEYIEEIQKLNKDDFVHGILCFRPLPKHLCEEVIEQYIDSRKDVDCFSPINIGKLMYGDEDAFPPCTPKAVVEILDYYGIDLVGKKVAVIGRSLVVGKPLSLLLLNRDATVTICHSKTENIKDITKSSDIIISCVGRAKFIDSTYFNDKAIVLDVGINFDEDGKLCGDVDTEDVMAKISLITPVPGGVGTVTTSVLASHVIKACKNITQAKI